MSMSAVASHRWRWLEFFHWSTWAQRSSTSALTDSRQLVVLNERPSTAKTPRRCKVRVSSRPSARLPAADWFRSSNSPWSCSRAARASGVRRAVVGALEAPAPVPLLDRGQVAHHILALVPLAPVHQRAVAEHFLDRRSQALAPVENHEQPVRRIKTAVDQRTQEGRQNLRVLRVRLHEAQEAFLP